ncbi:hypothetical protein LO762_04255 [Actinocorallia sp. API 0066]|uniref:hypothetical protein n=1 Tax=Actinocorallia sp. API 0066 TaxID=2896846 RepID=UPI001E3CC9B3|nr:hypothetical protein [Actinocorallia sp. API 0066]MCD0448412.1 hypothetical protein [Actinocorallia sp. API 0066]
MNKPDLDKAVEKAKKSFFDLFGLMMAYELDFKILTLLLEWPTPVAAAYKQWAADTNAVARILAARDGVEDGDKLSEADRARYTVRAWELIES